MVLREVLPALRRELGDVFEYRDSHASDIIRDWHRRRHLDYNRRKHPERVDAYKKRTNKNGYIGLVSEFIIPSFKSLFLIL
jgi:hypothetical protein